VSCFGDSHACRCITLLCSVVKQKSHLSYHLRRLLESKIKFLIQLAVHHGGLLPLGLAVVEPMPEREQRIAPGTETGGRCRQLISRTFWCEYHCLPPLRVPAAGRFLVTVDPVPVTWQPPSGIWVLGLATSSIIPPHGGVVKGLREGTLAGELGSLSLSSVGSNAQRCRRCSGCGLVRRGPGSSPGSYARLHPLPVSVPPQTTKAAIGSMVAPPCTGSNPGTGKTIPLNLQLLTRK
jgi:hypothetical protein